MQGARHRKGSSSGCHILQLTSRQGAGVPPSLWGPFAAPARAAPPASLTAPARTPAGSC